MRLGGKIFDTGSSPESWVAAHQKEGYRAAYCPVQPGAAEVDIRAYARAASEADLLIAEVGAWSNLIGPDAEERQRNFEANCAALALADAIGAVCCVNIPGSRSPTQWNGPHADNYSTATFNLTVEVVQQIIDTVKPRHSFFTLEIMGWGIPDSAESYRELIRAVDRPAFAVHFDPVNLIHSPRRYFLNADFLRNTIDALGPHIKSCHLKDVRLGGQHLVHLDECRPGTGNLHYPALLQALDPLSPDLPLMLEHLPDSSQYRKAAAFVRQCATESGISV